MTIQLHIVSFYQFFDCITDSFREWNQQLGDYMVDYKALQVEEKIAKGVRIQTIRSYITRHNL